MAGLMQEQDYVVEADALRSKKEQALRMRMDQLKLARDMLFGEITQPVSYITQEGVERREEPIDQARIEINQTPGRWGVYKPKWRRIDLSSDKLNQMDQETWEHLLNETTVHELAHYIAHMEAGKPQEHNEQWEAQMRLLKEAYGRAMVRAADEAAGIEYPDESRGLLR